MSPRQFYRELLVWRDRLQDERERDVTVAWHTANLTRAQKMPDLQVVQRRVRLARVQSPAEQRSQIAAFAEAYGLPMKRKRRRG